MGKDDDLNRCLDALLSFQRFKKAMDAYEVAVYKSDFVGEVDASRQDLYGRMEALTPLLEKRRKERDG